MAGGAKKEEKVVVVRNSPSKKKATATTPIPKKKPGGKGAAHDADVSKDTTTVTGGGTDRSADLSGRGGRGKSPKKMSSGRIGGKLSNLFKKKPGARTTPRSSKKEQAKTPAPEGKQGEGATHTTAETVQSENSQTRGTGDKTKMVVSRGKGKADNQEKAANVRKKESVKPSTKKGGGAHTPKKEETQESREVSMDVDDEGESKLIAMDKVKKKIPASTPQAEVERKEKEGRGKEKTMVTARKKQSVGQQAITVYDTGAGQTLNRLSVLRMLQERGWAECDEDFKTDHKINAEVNRATRYVITFNVPPDGDFYDANKVEIPGVDNKFIIAAAPTTDISSRENFWRMVYDANVANIFYVEEYKLTGAHFSPWKAGEAKDYGKMFVSCKKSAESKRDGMQAVLEVLPEGCSNSIIVRFVQCLKWPETLHRKDNKYSDLNHPTTFTRLLKDDKGLTMVVCSTGCGKSAMFVILHAAITTLNGSNPIPVHELLQKVRHDRWGAIQNMEQYLTLYQLYIYYIAAKSKPKSEVNDLCRELIKTLVVHPVKK